MIDHKAIFKREFGRKGYEPFDPSIADQSLLQNQLLEINRTRAHTLIQAHNRSNKLRMPFIYFDYVDDSTLNAKAFFDAKSKCGYIGIWVGTVWVIYDLFYRALSNPDILPTVGNASVEVRNRPYCSDGLPDDYAILDKWDNTRMSDVLPIDMARKKHAEDLAEIAMEFLIFHEMAHILCGHCEYSNSLGGFPFIMEFNARSSPGINPLAKQHLELMADGLAATTSWLRKLQNPRKSERDARAILERGTEIVVANELLMYDWMFAVYFMFWLFERKIDPSQLDQASHPPSPRRATISAAAVYGVLRAKASQETQEQWDRARMRAAKHLHNQLVIMGGKSLDKKMKKYYRFEQDGTMMRHLDKIVEEGRKISPEVDKFDHHDRSQFSSYTVP